MSFVRVAPSAAPTGARRLVSELAHWRSVCAMEDSRSGQSAELIPEETTVRPDDDLTASDELLDQAHRLRPSEAGVTLTAQAQVKAVQAVAAAIDRLAAAVEALPRT